MSRRGLSLVLFTLVLAGTLAAGAGAQAAPGDVLAFVRDGDIWTMNADGTNEVNLTNHPAIDEHPDWSPDGTQIAFISNRDDVPGNGDGNLEIFVMNADGSNVRQVTTLGKASFAPYFHPDGKRIIFSTNVHDPKGRDFDLYLIDVDGSGLERVTWNPTFDGFPMFSPDGKKLVWASNRNARERGETNIFIADWVP